MLGIVFMNITEAQTPKIAQFMMPGFYEHYKFYKFLDQFLIKYPEAKKENTDIYCYYGNIPFCTWDGGRTFTSYIPATIEQIEEIKNFYDNKKIRLVFTNSLLNTEHCLDRYNNIVLKTFHNLNN